MIIPEGISKSGMKVVEWLMKAYRSGLSGRATLKILRLMGLGYRTQDFYRDWRLIGEMFEKWEGMKYVRRDYPISEERYIPSESILRRRYYTVFEVEGFHRVTGEPLTKLITVAHDELKPRGELELMVEMEIVEGEYPIEVEKLTPVMGWRYG